MRVSFEDAVAGSRDLRFAVQGATDLVVRCGDDELALWDAACGACAACAAGRRTSCLEPLAPAPGDDPRWRTRRWPDAAAPEAALSLWMTAARAHDAVRQYPGAAPAVLVCGDGGVAVAAAVAASGAGARLVVVHGDVVATDDVVAAADESTVRGMLAAAGESGRADLVLAADGDLERAARRVRRGGAVAAVVEQRTWPLVTQMTQRELELLAPVDLVAAALACALPPDFARLAPGHHEL